MNSETTSEVTFLGTGTSVGVPVIGCDCDICRSAHPGNIRTRSSLYLKTPQHSVLIDSGPDLRQQALREKLKTIDAVIYTHSHLDHVAGFDELRAFCWHREEPLPLYAGPETMEVLHRMYPWAMSNTSRNYVRPEARIIAGPFTLDDLEIVPVPVQHATVETFGFRINFPSGHSLAYLSDVKEIPAASYDLLGALDVLVIDALRYEPHGTHMNVEESLAAAARIKAGQTFLTHLAHNIDYRTALADLPPTVTLAWDGLKLGFERDSPCAMLSPPIL